MKKCFPRYFNMAIIPIMFFALHAGRLNAQGRQNIDENWKFQFGHAGNPEKDFNYGIATVFSKSGSGMGTPINPAFNDSGWRVLNLPHDWAVELPFENSPNFDVQSHGYKPLGGYFPATSIGWYRKHFTIPAADTTGRYNISFDGIYRDAEIWINGFYLGNNKSGYVGISYDISDYINFERENVITVRVNATQYEGWFYEGAGIYRHVWLEHSGNIKFAGEAPFIHTDLLPGKAIVRVDMKIHNFCNVASGCTVCSYLLKRTGEVVSNPKPKSLMLALGGSKTLMISLSLPYPHLWSVNDPYLYRVKTIIKCGSKVMDSITQRIGVRTFRFDAREGFFLNGQHLKIQGTNNHQDHAGLGSALPDYINYYRIRLLKNLGVNAYRTSHNIPTSELLDACDSLGMLVLDEQRLLNSSPEYMNQFERMIIRDRNHPSVFMWSIGNEEGWVHTTNAGKKIALSLLAKQKELDPTRTSTYAADVPNIFKGVNEVIPVRGFNYRQFAVADYHRDHPTQPVIGTEMGSTVTTRGIYAKDSVRGYLPDQDITAPWWASTAETWWKLAADNKYWIGGFVWTGFDYRGEPTPFQWPNINSHFGIMDVCGFPKNLYYYYQSWWTDKDILHISPHWNWPGMAGKTIDVWVNSNADDVELFLNGKTQGKKGMPRNGHLQWTVNYEPGTLEAIGHKKGKKLVDKVETTGNVVEVVLTPYKTTMVADGKDATVINISLVDPEGREVPNADDLVKFKLTGNAKIIGVGNGDPSSHEPDKYEEGHWQRNAFNGKCQVIIQSGTEPGTIKFEASAAGLWSGSTDIITVSPVSIAHITSDKKYELKPSRARTNSIARMIGADISFLPQLEAEGIKFSDKGQQKDAIQIMKDHGFNYVRLRVFNNPANDSGYSPGKNYCDLQATKKLAKRVKDAGMKLLLDFHYSDYWADPGKQYKPAAWKKLTFDQLKQSLFTFTKDALMQLKEQGTLPDIVQVGNEINHGIVWPEGNVCNMNSLAQLLQAGVSAVKSVDPAIATMLHVALGGQNDESVFFLDNMIARGVQFDVIGESYYPKWHGTLDDLRDNLTDLVRRYQKDVIVVEYSANKEAVNKIVFDLPGNKGKGSFIWEPLSTWEAIFDRTGKSNELINVYDKLSHDYLK